MRPVLIINLFIIFMSWQTLAQNADSAQTPCQLELHRKTGLLLINGESSNFLESKYCERMLLNSTHEAFEAGHDLPADKLDVTNEPIVWASQAPGYFDLEPLNDINHQAALLWNQLVDCHGSAEKARRAYYELNSKCDLDKSIKSFTRNVHLYLETTQVFQKRDYVKGRYHPLLTQIFLENANATSWMSASDKRAGNIGFYRELIIEFLSQGNSLESLETSTNEKEIIKWSALREFIHSNPDAKSLFYIQNRKINSILLIGHNTSMSRCESFGLWPGVTRLIVSGLGSDPNNYQLGINALDKIVANACGDIRYYRTYYSYSSRESVDVLKLFRDMAVRFELH
ncbi:MAG TPA: hypothetical protein VN132_16460 [Bdellovibrio sp.]|nr:hypothetical protein [Bdellovibrio sp.]